MHFIIRKFSKSVLHLRNAEYASTVVLRPKKDKAKSPSQNAYFRDTKIIRVRGGKGGNGKVSFLTLWCNERAGPDGGDGGNGGHVIFQASNDVQNLNHLYNTIKGDDGEQGATKECHGKSAKHTILKVPIGTIIRNQSGVIVGDLNNENKMFIAARGGAGGKGNVFFTTDVQKTVKVCEYGPEGEDATYVLEMRTMADIGIIGFPNAGKSTLLSAITRAAPKIAPYPFTTIHPNIGTIKYTDHFQLCIADLPGIIQNAHLNKGLGIRFLKHIERCSVLIMLIDASCEKPWNQYHDLTSEIAHFNKNLLNYPKIIVANKIDEPEAECNLQTIREKLNEPIIGISAKLGTNLKQLLTVLRNTFESRTLSK